MIFLSLLFKKTFFLSPGPPAFVLPKLDREV